MAKKPKLQKLFDNDLVDKETSLMFVEIEKLKHTTRNTFDLLEGEKLEEMKSSIASIGILTPLIVQKDNDGYYEVIAGNNRLNIAKMLGINKLPIRVVENLKDSDKDIIIFETNIQRSFEDLTFKQRAKAIYHYYNAIKQQGKRNDLIEVVNMDTEKDTPKGGFKLGSTQMWKYSKFHTLIEPIQDLVDTTDKLTFSLAVEMSSLDVSIQEYLYELISNYNINISLLHIKNLKTYKKDDLTLDNIKKLILDDCTENADESVVVKDKVGSLKTKKAKEYKVSKKIIDKYIPKGLSNEEKDIEVTKAFELYFKNNTTSFTE